MSSGSQFNSSNQHNQNNFNFRGLANCNPSGNRFKAQFNLQHAQQLSQQMISNSHIGSSPQATQLSSNIIPQFDNVILNNQQHINHFPNDKMQLTRCQIFNEEISQTYNDVNAPFISMYSEIPFQRMQANQNALSNYDYTDSHHASTNNTQKIFKTNPSNLNNNSNYQQLSSNSLENFETPSHFHQGSQNTQNETQTEIAHRVKNNLILGQNSIQIDNTSNIKNQGSKRKLDNNEFEFGIKKTKSLSESNINNCTNKSIESVEKKFKSKSRKEVKNESPEEKRKRERANEQERIRMSKFNSALDNLKIFIHSRFQLIFDSGSGALKQEIMDILSRKPNGSMEFSELSNEQLSNIISQISSNPKVSTNLHFNDENVFNQSSLSNSDRSDEDSGELDQVLLAKQFDEMEKIYFTKDLSAYNLSQKKLTKILTLRAATLYIKVLEYIVKELIN